MSVNTRFRHRDAHQPQMPGEPRTTRDLELARAWASAYDELVETCRRVLCEPLPASDVRRISEQLRRAMARRDYWLAQVVELSEQVSRPR